MKTTFILNTSAKPAEDGWAQLAPLGDFPGMAMVTLSDGSQSKHSAIQRIDAQTVQALVDNFKSPWAKLKRFFTGCWTLNGHPDLEPSTYTDCGPKGMIADLQKRADGLYGLPVFTEEGRQIVESQPTYFSAVWDSTPDGEQDGKPIYRPANLISAGLTTTPNLPVHILNSAPTPSRGRREESQISSASDISVNPCVSAGTEPAMSFQFASVVSNPEPTTPSLHDSTTPLPNTMNKPKLQTVLAKHGITIDPNASDDAIESALETGLAAQATSRATLANSAESARTDATTAQSRFDTERAARIEDTLAYGLETGRITAADKDGWKTRLTANFANAKAELTASPAKLKTISEIEGKTTRTFANTAEKIAEVQRLVSEQMAKGADYDTAFTTVTESHPNLIS